MLSFGFKLLNQTFVFISCCITGVQKIESDETAAARIKIIKKMASKYPIPELYLMMCKTPKLKVAIAFCTRYD
jgi:hypothetical protein